MRVSLVLAVLAVLVLGAGWLSASDLKWEATVLDLKAERGQKKVEGEFRFTNGSQGPVEIRGVQSSCGCTTAELAKKVYGPGESGVVKAVFTVGGRKGAQKKTIVVRSGDAKSPPDVLMLRVEIPDTFSLNEEALRWKVGAPGEAQFFEFTPEEGGFALKGVRVVSGDFVASLEPVEEGKPFRVRVAPGSTAQAVRGKICVEAAEPGKRFIYLPVEVEEKYEG